MKGKFKSHSCAAKESHLKSVGRTKPPALLNDLERVQLRVARAIVRNTTLIAGRVNDPTGSSPHVLCRGEGENTALAFFGSFLLGKVLLHYRPHWCLVHSYNLLVLAFLTPSVFLLLHRLVTCRPFSVKLSPSGTGCLLLSSLLRLSLPFGQRFDASLSLSLISSSAMVSLSYFLSFLS